MFLREVDDAVRQDQLADAARNYAKPIGAAVVAGLAVLAGYLWYDSHKASVTDAHAEQFTTALDQVEAGQLDGGKAKAATLVTEGGAGYKAGTQLLNAGILAQQGKADAAANTFAAVAADANAPQAYRDLANVRFVALRFDAMKPDEVIAKLKPLAVPGNAFFSSAGELVGLAYMKQGHNDLASRCSPRSPRKRTRTIRCAAACANSPGCWASIQLKMQGKLQQKPPRKAKAHHRRQPSPHSQHPHNDRARDPQFDQEPAHDPLSSPSRA